MGEPYVVRIPFVGIMSLYAIGRPASGPRSPAFRASSFFAAESASSGKNVTIALTFGFTRSICAINARTTSVAESLRVRRSCASLRAGVKQSSAEVNGGVSTARRAASCAVEFHRLAAQRNVHRHLGGFHERGCL